MPMQFDLFNADKDIDNACRILSLAFAGTPEGVREWLTNAGAQNLRVMRGGDGAPAGATLLRVPMGQFFGGRSVPMVGIAGVGVAPEIRGKGAAKTMMIEALREIRREGVPLSSLYPATSTLYRRVGYENAGPHMEHRFPVARIKPAREVQQVRPYVEADLPALKACYTRFASGCDGALDRGAYIWNRVFTPRTGPCVGYVVEEQDNASGPCGGACITGYLFFRQERDGITGRHDIEASDLIANTPRAAKRLLGFIGEFGSMATDLVVRAGVCHPLLPICDEPRGLRTTFKDYWMLRIVDVAGALAARGYAPGLTAGIELDVVDEILPENAGRWVLRVQDGKGTAERGGSGALKCDVRGLAAMYAGFLTPRLLGAWGLAEGTEGEFRSASAIFGGHSMGFCDFF